MIDEDLLPLDILRAAKLRRSLRPDFYEWWPRFSPQELLPRLSHLPPTSATLLTLANLRALNVLSPSIFNAWRDEFMGLDWRAQARDAACVMRQVGISESVCQALASVDRSVFLPPDRSFLAFINTSAPLSDASNATAFGLCGIVAQAVLRCMPRRIIEVGFGSGALATLICRLFGKDLDYIAYESDVSLMPLWEQACRRIPSARHIKVCWRSFGEQDLSLKSGDLLLFSCAPSPDLVRSIESAIIESNNARALVPNIISLNDFNRFFGGMLRWRGQGIDSYADYLNNPRAYMQLQLISAIDGHIVRERICGNVQYIPWVAPNSAASAEENYSAMSLLLDGRV